jgi:hypothetical protein
MLEVEPSVPSNALVKEHKPNSTSAFGRYTDDCACSFKVNGMKIVVDSKITKRRRVAFDAQTTVRTTRTI